MMRIPFIALVLVCLLTACNDERPSAAPTPFPAGKSKYQLPVLPDIDAGTC
jgi:hypothetical protein